MVGETTWVDRGGVGKDDVPLEEIVVEINDSGSQGSLLTVCLAQYT